MKRWLLSFCPLIVLSLTGCAGYQFNGAKPAKLEGITKLYVPTFQNETLEPRLSVLVTNAVIKQIQASGSYQIVNESDSEATLKGTITTIERSQWRSVRSNTLRTKELLGRLKLNYKVVDTSGVMIHRGRVQATSYVPLDANWQTSERQLLSEAAERMSVTL
ncbi:MAG: hypothetical protein JWO89_680, partial [Verrucomicrobiaceae bacterium]|nr:hypothetical protein [Verrucomicrobiaceae bacterium]